jgi:hypothetical protein
MQPGLRIIVCAFAFTTAYAGVSESQAPKRKNNVVGAIWTFNLAKGPRGPGAERHKINFRVYNREIFLGPKKVGFVKPKGPLDSTLTIDGFPRMNGTATITKVRNFDPPQWQGTFKQDDGTEWRLSIDGVEG